MSDTSQTQYQNTRPIVGDFSNLKAPSKLLLAIEGRSMLELGAGVLSVPLLKTMLSRPYQAGLPVLVLPGLGAGDFTTKLLRSFLDSEGYTTYPWAMGVNRGMQGNTLPSIVERVKQIYAKHNTPVAIVGQSLGGVFAREAAKALPHMTRQVITLGSPFTGSIDATNAKYAYTLLSGKKITEQDREFFSKVREKPSVPTTSVYSKMDGVVAWQCSIEENKDKGENIELLGASHIGMCSSPQALYLIAERLGQSPENWKPFTVNPLFKHMFKVEY